jgi:hypothetical protein
MTGKAILPQHLFKPRHNTFIAGAFKQPVEFLNAGGSANEDLNSARIADEIRVIFLRDADLPRLRTYGARKHPLTIERRHQNPPRTGAPEPRSPFPDSILGPFFGLAFGGALSRAEFTGLPCNSGPFLPKIWEVSWRDFPQKSVRLVRGQKKANCLLTRL